MAQGNVPYSMVDPTKMFWFNQIVFWVQHETEEKVKYIYNEEADRRWLRFITVAFICDPIFHSFIHTIQIYKSAH